MAIIIISSFQVYSVNYFIWILYLAGVNDEYKGYLPSKYQKVCYFIKFTSVLLLTLLLVLFRFRN